MASVRVLRIWALACVAVLLLVAQASAAGETRYKDDVFAKVSVKRDLVYGQGPATTDAPAEDLTLDLYRPKHDPVKKRPALIWVHGGGFASGDKASGPAAELARRYAHKGYVTVSINYRLLAPNGCDGAGGVTPECYNAAIEAVHDGQAAVRYLRANAKRLRVDRKRIGIGGESAGAIVACGAGVLSANPGTSGNPGPSSAVGTFVSISGGLPGGIFVDENTAPGILFASVDDPVVPYSWSVETAEKMESFGIPVKLTSFPGAVHVPFAQYGDVITRQSTKFLYAQLNLKHARR